MPTLEGKHISFAYEREDVLEDLHILARPGQILALIGPNGAGKTTLLKVMARLLPPQEGKVLLDGRDLWSISPRHAAQDLALSPQSEANWPFSVEQIVALGRTPHRGWLLPLSNHDRQTIDSALRRTGLWSLRDRIATELSGGEQRRVILARALAQEPSVLLLDEPTAYLDLKYQSEILELIQHLAHEDGLTVVIIMHDLNQAALYADRVALLLNGRLLAVGDPRTVLTTENLTEAYGLPVIVSEHPVYHTPLVVPVLSRLADGREEAGKPEEAGEPQQVGEPKHVAEKELVS